VNLQNWPCLHSCAALCMLYPLVDRNVYVLVYEYVSSLRHLTSSPNASAFWDYWHKVLRHAMEFWGRGFKASREIWDSYTVYVPLVWDTCAPCIRYTKVQYHIGMPPSWYSVCADPYVSHACSAQGPSWGPSSRAFWQCTDLICACNDCWLAIKCT